MLMDVPITEFVLAGSLEELKAGRPKSWNHRQADIF
jgi:hypothetical protein